MINFIEAEPKKEESKKRTARFYFKEPPVFFDKLRVLQVFSCFYNIFLYRTKDEIGQSWALFQLITCFIGYEKRLWEIISLCVYAKSDNINVCSMNSDTLGISTIYEVVMAFSKGYSDLEMGDTLLLYNHAISDKSIILLCQDLSALETQIEKMKNNSENIKKYEGINIDNPNFAMAYLLQKALLLSLNVDG